MQTKADRRDSKRRSRRDNRSDGLAAFRYHGRPAELAAAKIANSRFRRAAKRIRHAHSIPRS